MAFRAAQPFPPAKGSDTGSSPVLLTMPLAVGWSSTDRTTFPRQTSTESADIPPCRTSPPYSVPRPDSVAVQPLSVTAPPVWVLPVHHRASLGLSWGLGFTFISTNKIRQRRSLVQTKPCQCNPRQPVTGSWAACGPQGEIIAPLRYRQTYSYTAGSAPRIHGHMVLDSSRTDGLEPARKVSRKAAVHREGGAIVQ